MSWLPRQRWSEQFPGGWQFLVGILEPIGIELLREVLVNPGVRLRVGWFSGVGQTIQEVVCCNLLPCLRKQLFPKSVHSELGVLGILDAVAVYLEYFDARDGWISERSIDQHGGTEVGSLPIQQRVV